MRRLRRVYVYSEYWYNNILMAKPIGIGYLSLLYTRPVSRHNTIECTRVLRLDAVSLDVSIGVDINYHTYSYTMSVFESAVYHSVRSKNDTLIRFLLKVCSPDLNGDSGFPLKTAAGYQDVSLFRTLVSAGANLEYAIEHDHAGNIQWTLNSNKEFSEFTTPAPFTRCPSKKEKE